ncbi:MAG: cobyrinate a,c-diamide synthase [Lachnospiraceae bacterium]|nr:cobyrinate a,c-diamide synthase [Lachnospiraceae bacterium]
MSMKRVMIAAAGSNSGKTCISCALMAAYKEAGLNVSGAKCGPDYIDPMFHEIVLGIPSVNLDPYFSEKKELRSLTAAACRESDILIIEGVMGLYDGLGGVKTEASSYDLAVKTDTPIILVIDAKGVGITVIQIIRGILSADKKHLIKGIILNKVSKSYANIIAPLIKEQTGVAVCGTMPYDASFGIESRHLGLNLPHEVKDLKSKVAGAAGKIRDNSDLGMILKIASEAKEIKDGNKDIDIHNEDAVSKPVLAVARDEAFCFYYRENLRLFEKNGCRIEYFSPIRDEGLPEGCAGVLLGGGYPELYLQELSSNRKMKNAVRKAVSSGIPLLAECGGFMYLQNSIKLKDCGRKKMSGIFAGDCEMKDKLVRFGYIELTSKKNTAYIKRGEKIKAHEFHYFDCTDNGSSLIAMKPVTKRSYDCIKAEGNILCGFPHLYYPSCPELVSRFTEKMREYANE